MIPGKLFFPDQSRPWRENRSSSLNGRQSEFSTLCRIEVAGGICTDSRRTLSNHCCLWPQILPTRNGFLECRPMGLHPKGSWCVVFDEKELGTWLSSLSTGNSRLSTRRIR